MPQITHARVTNGNDFPIDVRYDGVPIIFEPGKATRIPLAAAVMLFDMPVDVEGNVTWRIDAKAWAHFSRYLGWTNIEPMDMEGGKRESMSAAFARVTGEAARRCALIKVEPVSMVLQEVEPTEELLEPPEAKVEEAPKRSRRGGIAAP